VKRHYLPLCITEQHGGFDIEFERLQMRDHREQFEAGTVAHRCDAEIKFAVLCGQGHRFRGHAIFARNDPASGPWSEPYVSMELLSESPGAGGYPCPPELLPAVVETCRARLDERGFKAGEWELEDRAHLLSAPDRSRTTSTPERPDAPGDSALNRKISVAPLSDRLRAIFTDNVLNQLKRAPVTDALAYRIHVLTGDGLDDGPARGWQVQFCDTQQAAWSNYLEAGARHGLLDDPHGKELTSRLRGVDDENFRSAMAECEAAWYLGSKLGLDVSARPRGRARSELELLVKLPDGEVHVEVKSPLREPVFDGLARTVDDSDILDRCVGDASKQFDKDARNLLMLVGRMTLGARARRFFIDAFYARRVMVFTKNLGTHEVGPMRTEFRDPGRFLRVWPGESGPRHTRISGVLYVEERIRERRAENGEIECGAEHDVLMFHNPHALRRLPEDPWGNCPQVVLRGEDLEWTDGEAI